jgi:hypothetical protein
MGKKTQKIPNSRVSQFQIFGSFSVSSASSADIAHLRYMNQELERLRLRGFDGSAGAASGGR